MMEEPSIHRLKSMHYRTVDISNQCMDCLHHLIYEADTIEVDFEYVEDMKRVNNAMTLMGKARVRA